MLGGTPPKKNYFITSGRKDVHLLFIPEGFFQPTTGPLFWSAKKTVEQEPKSPEEFQQANHREMGLAFVIFR